MSEFFLFLMIIGSSWGGAMLISFLRGHTLLAQVKLLGMVSFVAGEVLRRFVLTTPWILWVGLMAFGAAIYLPALLYTWHCEKDYSALNL
jgi:uncharacterized transporter YbjL